LNEAGAKSNFKIAIFSYNFYTSIPPRAALSLSVDESSSISIHNNPTLFLILHLFPAKTVYKYVIAPPEDVPLFAVDEAHVSIILDTSQR